MEDKDPFRQVSAGSMPSGSYPSYLNSPKSKHLKTKGWINRILRFLGIGEIVIQEGPLISFLRKHWFGLALIILSALLVYRQGYLNALRAAPAKEQYYTDAGTGSDAQESNLRAGTRMSYKVKPVAQIPEAELAEYLSRFRDVALKEERKFGIPHKVLLATGLIMSSAGHSTLAQEANNHMGILCESNVVPGEKLTYLFQNQCMARFENAWTSFRAFSLMVTEGRYKHLKAKAGKNPQNWIALLSNDVYPWIPNFTTEMKVALSLL